MGAGDGKEWREEKDWARLDSNQRRRKPTGLQPVSFGHSDTRPENLRSGKIACTAGGCKRKAIGRRSCDSHIMGIMKPVSDEAKTTRDAARPSPGPLRLVWWVLYRLILPLAACMVFGTACHEIVGHGLTGVLFGGTITDVEILGARVYPEIKWLGWEGYYGRIWVDGIKTERGEYWMLLGGAGSTWLVSVIAVCLLWMRQWRGPARRVLAWLGVWWIDMFTYLMPSWGLKRSILWGGARSEPYEAAVGLGAPGWAVQVGIVGSCILLAIALVVRLRMAGRVPLVKQRA